MKNILRFICVFTFILAATTHAGSIKKWVDADGNVSFGDAPPPSVTNSEKVKVQESYKPSAPSSTAPSSLPSSSPSNSPATDDYYSPQNQLRRMKAQETQERLERQQKKSAARSEELYRKQMEVYDRSAVQKGRVDEANCELYKAKLNEHEYQMQRGYTSEGDRLSQEKRLAVLNRLKAGYCR